MDIRAVKINRNLKNNNNENFTFETLDKNENNKIVYNKNIIDLDLLFEKQLQKLKEINREDESNNNENYNEMIIHLNNNTNNNFNEISSNKIQNNENKIIINSNNNQNNNYNSENNNKINKNHIRPFSYYSKNNKSLPRISSQKNIKNIHQEENIIRNDLTIKNDNTKLAPISSRLKSPLHKDYGKVPKYLKEMKMKAEILKDLQNKKKEEEKYPKGTRLLSEEERLLTLNKLKESKKELENLIEKLPITLNSLSLRNKQQRLYKELDEIEQAIITFSRNQVFVKIDS